MASFQGLDLDTIRALLEGQEDVLTPAFSKEQAFFRSVPCPACHSQAVEGRIDPNRPFQPGALLPTRYSACASCGTEFDPYTGFVRRVTASSG